MVKRHVSRGTAAVLPAVYLNQAAADEAEAATGVLPAMSASSAASSTGRDSIGECDAESVRASAAFAAIFRCTSGGMILSSVQTT